MSAPLVILDASSAAPQGRSVVSLILLGGMPRGRRWLGEKLRRATTIKRLKVSREPLDLTFDPTSQAQPRPAV